MGLIVLIAVGAIFGWLTSIIMRGDDAREVSVNVAIGTIGALTAGALASSDSLLAGLSAGALMLGLAGAAIALGVFNLARGRLVR